MSIHLVITRLLLTLGVVMLVGACATEQKVTKTQVKKDWRGRPEAFSVGKDEDGNPVMKSDRRSSLEGKRNTSFAGKDFRGEDYTKKSYRKKRWFGNSKYTKKEYQGNTDASSYKREPWYVRQQARAGDQRSRADGKRFAANPFRTGTAREQGASRMTRPSDAETNVRRRVFKQPEITHWKKQKGLSVKDTNRMLGR